MSKIPLTSEQRRKHNRTYYENGGKEKISARNTAHRQRNREFVQGVRSTTPCADCGIQYDWWIMEFDHVRGSKRGEVSKLSNQMYSLKAIQEEIAKCEIVCSNCHADRTYKRAIDVMVA